MTLSAPLVVSVGAAYLTLLFAVAFFTDRLAERGGARFLGSPVVYTLSLAVYCTSWTFFGAVGTATRSGAEFLTIYIGPTLALMAWWLFLPKMVRIAKAQRITSIADFLGTRYGKSRTVALLVTTVALASVTPYIALQLIAIGRSFAALAGSAIDGGTAALWTAAIMAFFVIAFGTRRVNADESQPGIVAAIALESVVKLAALLVVAALALVVLDGAPAVEARAANVSEALAAIARIEGEGGARWVVLTTLSAAAIVCLPRQFQVAVVENRDERHIAVASWLFPAYLFMLTLAVLPIATAGLTRLPAGLEPDLYVLSLPLAEGSATVALVAFIGGLSAATSMMIVAALALAVMISNHVVAPALAGRSGGSRGLTRAVLATRRVAIALVMGLGALYAQLHGAGGGLASIGLIAFAGVVQFAPGLIAGLFWRGANRTGAIAGLVAGSLAWLVLLFLPSFGAAAGTVELARTVLLPASLAAGPQAVDPLVFGVSVSLALNVTLLVAGSLAARPSAIDELQATLFVDAMLRGGPEPTLPRSARRRDLVRLARRILGPSSAHRLVARVEAEGGEVAGSALVAEVEREVAAAVGASSAHALIAPIARGEAVTLDAAIALVRETQDAIAASRALGVRSVELERHTAELAAANRALTALLAEKDAFLSRVSHEMRTPVTAVRSFAELLREGAPDEARAARFVDIILAESERLSRLLDDILDLSRLEAGVAPLHTERLEAHGALAEAAAVMEGFADRRGVRLTLAQAAPAFVDADADRLKQVLVNLISNAIKFSSGGEVVVGAAREGLSVVFRVADDGAGVPDAVRAKLFTKFAAERSASSPTGAGLGLAISRQIMTALGGTLVLEATGPSGSTFAASLPARSAPGLRAAQ